MVLVLSFAAVVALGQFIPTSAGDAQNESEPPTVTAVAPAEQAGEPPPQSTSPAPSTSGGAPSAGSNWEAGTITENALIRLLGVQPGMRNSESTFDPSVEETDNAGRVKVCVTVPADMKAPTRWQQDGNNTSRYCATFSRGSIVEIILERRPS